jgi:regulator of protease activity HflC (stomatin/prohibitin superfamily)
MVLIIIGILVLVAGYSLHKNPEYGRFARPIRIIAFMIMLAGLLTKSIVQINAGEIGVKSLFGKVQDDVLRSGLHFINPFVNVQRLDIKTQNYTMSGIHDEGNQSGDDAIRVLTSDGLEVTIDLTVLYKLLPSEAPASCAGNRSGLYR